MNDVLMTVVDGIIMYNNRIVVPKELQQGVLEELYASHQGQKRAKQRDRQTVCTGQGLPKM